MVFGAPAFLRLFAVPCLLLLAASTAGAETISGSAGLLVTVNRTGSYEVTVPSPAWRFAGNIGVPLSNLSIQNGTDPSTGPYSEISFAFFNGVPRTASIRAYYSSQAVLFSVTLPSGGPNTFAFPALASYPKGLAHIAFCGLFGYPSFFGSNAESPWVFFDSAMNSVILSPASHFMVASTGLSGANEVVSGISPKIATLPAGFTHQTLLVVERGINHAFDTWGKLLTGVTGKVRPSNDADVTLNRLGYWTDAGSTYYYATEPGMSYPQTLSAVKSEFERRGVPLGYLQLDSWFYPKGAAADWRSREDGIFEYLATPTLFKSPLAEFQRGLGIPLVAHSRWIDPQSPYRQQYRMSGTVSTDPLYWGEVARYLASSGAAGFEQDWLADRATTEFNLTDGDDFLDNMASAMARQNLNIQYCSGTARHFLQSTKYSNLTTIRVSEDRFERTRWTNFLYASRLASALGIWPFTDVLMSSETDNLLIATLSAGPVGVGDRLGTLDVANLRRAVRSDGVIVKPDVPLAPIDVSFWSDSHNGRAPMIAATYSDFGDLQARYLFLYPQGDITRATFRLADAGVTRRVYLYEYFQNSGRLVNPEEWLSQDVAGYRYQVAAPVGMSGMALVGDTGHFVTLGRKRITALSDDGTLRVTVAFAPGEQSRTLLGYSPDWPSAKAVAGGAGAVLYDEATGQFTMQVTSGRDGVASVEISRSGAATGHPRPSPLPGRAPRTKN